MMILVVDDEPLVAQTLCLIFRKNGYAAESVHSAADALKFTSSRTPDLILVDIEMPERDGVLLMSDLAQTLPECPILVLTGSYRDLNRVHECAEKLTVAVKVLTKPCLPVDLLHAADRMLQVA